MQPDGRPREVTRPQPTPARRHSTSAPHPRDNPAPRRKRQYSPDEKAEVAETRRRGACESCRGRKVKCKHGKPPEVQDLDTQRGIPLRPPNPESAPSFASSVSEISSLVTSTSRSTISDGSFRTESAASEPGRFYPHIASSDQPRASWNGSRGHEQEDFLTQQAYMKSGLAEQKFDGLSSPFVDVNSTSYNPQARNDVGNMMSNLPYGQITTKQQQPQQSARQVPRQDRLGPSRVLGFSQESQAESMVSRSQTYQGPLMNQSGQQRTPSKAVPSTIPRTAGLAFNEDPTTMQRHLLSESRVSYTPGGSSQQGFPPRSSRQRPERTMNMVPRPLFGQVAMPQQRTVPGQAQQQQQPKVYSSSRVPHESARNNQGQQHQLYTYKDDPVPFHPAFPSQVQHNSHQAPIAPQNFDLLGSATSRSFSNTASGLASRRLSTIAPVPQGSYLAVPDSSSPQHTIAEPTRGMMISEDAERLRARHNSTRMPQQQAALQQYQQNGSQPVQMLPRFSQPAPIPSYRPPYPAEGFRRSSSQQPFSGSRIRTVCEICGGSEKHAYDCPYNNT